MIVKRVEHPLALGAFPWPLLENRAATVSIVGPLSAIIRVCSRTQQGPLPPSSVVPYTLPAASRIRVPQGTAASLPPS
jgi:hypothetical protein